MRNNQPNAAERTGQLTRGEVRQEALKTKLRFGDKGERPAVPTNPKNATGTPKYAHAHVMKPAVLEHCGIIVAGA